MTKKQRMECFHTLLSDYVKDAPIPSELSAECFAPPYFTLFRIAAFSLQIRSSYAF